MSDEITFGFAIGKTLTYGVRIASGGQRTAAGTSLPEEGATGYYHADNSDIVVSDIVIVKEGSLVVGYGEYLPKVDLSEIVTDLSDIDDKIDIVDSNVDQVIEDLAISDSDYDDRPKEKIADVIIGGLIS